MFVVVYEMKVKEGRLAQFEKSWAEVTDFIYKRCGSLGSRLHKTDVDRVYIAYAQWPSKEQYFLEHNDAISDEETLSREAMVDSTEEIKTLYHMEVVDNRVQRKMYEHS